MGEAGSKDMTHMGFSTDPKVEVLEAPIVLHTLPVPGEVGPEVSKVVSLPGV